MSGHSKWSQIKRQKATNDQSRSNEFAKMSRLITIAVHEGGGIADPENNFKLRLTIERAKYINMPKDTIQRAIDKAVGGEGSQMKEVVYEGFGPGGSAVMISATTDNSNRTHADIKQTLERNGGKMGGQNAVAYLFQKCGIALFNKANLDEQSIFDFADKMSALDISFDPEDDAYIIYFPFEHLGKVKNIHTLSQPEELDSYYRSISPIQLEQGDKDKLDKLCEKLEGLDDVQNVYTNAQ